MFSVKSYQEREAIDIEKLRIENPELDIVEVAYDGDGKLFAMATREIPESIKISKGIFRSNECL